MKGSEMGAIRSTKGHKTMNLKRHPLTGTTGRRQDNIKWIFEKKQGVEVYTWWVHRRCL